MAHDLFDRLERDAWTLPSDDGRAELRVTELGEGPPVVVLHGGPGVHFGYLVDAVRRSLARARFVLFDQRGSLLSPVPADQVDRLDVAELITDLESLRVALGRDRLRLFGHSWGAQLALLYAQAFPHRVDGLILTGSAGPAGLSEGERVAVVERQERLRNRPEVTAAIRAAGLDGDPDRLTARQRSQRYRITGLASFSIWRIEKWRQVRSMHWNRSAAVAIDRSLAAAAPLRPELLDAGIRISVLQGDRDYLDPGAGRWQAAARDHPNVSVTVIADAGHNAWIDDPDAFDRALGEALRP